MCAAFGIGSSDPSPALHPGAGARLYESTASRRLTRARAEAQPAPPLLRCDELDANASASSPSPPAEVTGSSSAGCALRSRATTSPISRPTPAIAPRSAPARFYTVADANRWEKVKLARSAVKIAWVLLRERPDVVISTGAAPGYLAIRGARCSARGPPGSTASPTSRSSRCRARWPAPGRSVPHAVAASRRRARRLRGRRPVIFVTVGTQLAFDRLIGAVDAWAGAAARPRGVRADRARRASARAYRVRAVRRRRTNAARAWTRPTRSSPTRAWGRSSARSSSASRCSSCRGRALGEHRNDHQVATARRFAELGR